ncbi:hypothetical protein GmHk_14G041141 [Glycine max]|nr:hypothetical protein GmHk_14G041141 [Glycine max]
MEFLLRSSVPNSFIKKTLTALPLSPVEPRLKKTLLLRILQTLLRTTTVSEIVLDILEDLSPISNVNTARTAQSPWSAPSSTSPRALTLSMAIFGELVQWHDEIEDALGEDSKETRERLAGLNSRRDAMNEVRVYLKEAWEMMGPSFLETVAATEKKNDDGACMEDVAMHYENQEPLEESVDVN